MSREPVLLPPDLSPDTIAEPASGLSPHVGRSTASDERRRLVLRATPLVALSIVLPTFAGVVWFQAVAWASIAAFATRMWRKPSAASAMSAWVPVAAGFSLFALGDLFLAIDEHIAAATGLVITADVACLAGYVALAIGLSALVRTDPTDRGRTALIDAAIVVTPIAVVGWIYLIGPTIGDPAITWAQRLVATAFPLGDLLCLALVVRLVAGRRRHHRHHRRPGPHQRDHHTARPDRRRRDRSACTLVIGAVVLLLAADAMFLSVALHADHLGNRWSSGWSTALSLAAYCVLGAAGSRPLRRTDTARSVDDDLLSTRRLVLLAAAALVTPLLLAVQWFRGQEVTVPLVVTGTVVSFLLVVVRMVGLVHALEFSRSQLRFEANHDLLTGLPNRQSFTRSLDAALADGLPGALLFVDLDRFKLVNDTLGHQAGDEVLVEVADILRECVRDGDVVARLAGDEFVVMIEGCELDEATTIAGRLVDRLYIERRTPVGSGAGTVSDIGADGVLSVTASVGMVTWTADTRPERAHQLVRAADHAMYRAKHATGDRVVITAL